MIYFIIRALFDKILLCIPVIRDSNVVQLDVDSEVNHVVGPLNPNAVDQREPVFVGGVPGKTCWCCYNFVPKCQHSLKQKQKCLVFF